MKMEKLLEKLDSYFKRGAKKKSIQRERIDELLEQLEEKKKKLEKKLRDETNSTKKKRLTTELKIVTLQLKKGHKRRDELKDKHK